ncbi:MAG: hypothetical protein AAF372_00655, partial [Pseudomonadota bacterium]
WLVAIVEPICSATVAALWKMPGFDKRMNRCMSDDLAEGKPTLPIIYAIKNGATDQAEKLKAIIRQGDRDQLDLVLKIIHATKALDYTEQIARQEADNAKHAIECLSESEYKTALYSLAEFAVSRLY